MKTLMILLGIGLTHETAGGIFIGNYFVIYIFFLYSKAVMSGFLKILHFSSLYRVSVVNIYVSVIYHK